MTLSDLEWLFYVKFCFRAGMSRALSRGIAIVSRPSVRLSEYSESSRGFLKRGRPTTTGWSKTAIFSAFRRYIFGTFRDKAKLLYGNI